MTNGARYSRNRRNRVQLKADAHALFTRLERDGILPECHLEAVNNIRSRLAPGGNPAAPVHAINRATRPMLDLSTSHISEETALYLQYHRASCYQKGDYGWFVHVPDDANEQDDPADLRTVLDFARARGFAWIMLDRDGDVLDGLPTFEW